LLQKGSRLREEPKRETRERLIANSFFIHETEKLQRREPVIPGLLSQKLFNIMTFVLCDDGLRVLWIVMISTHFRGTNLSSVVNASFLSEKRFKCWMREGKKGVVVTAYVDVSSLKTPFSKPSWRMSMACGSPCSGVQPRWGSFS